MIQIGTVGPLQALEDLHRTAEALSAWQKTLAQQIHAGLAPLYRSVAEALHPTRAFREAARQIAESHQRLLSNLAPVLQASVELDRILTPVSARLADFNAALRRAAFPQLYTLARAVEDPQTEVGFLHLLWQADGELNRGRFEKADTVIGLVAGDLIRSPLDREAARLALDRVLREGLWDHLWTDRPWAADGAGLHGYVRRRIHGAIARARRIRLTAPAEVISLEEVPVEPALPDFTAEVDTRLDLTRLPCRQEDAQAALLLSEDLSWREAAGVVAPWVLEDETTFLRWQRATRQRLQRRLREALYDVK